MKQISPKLLLLVFLTPALYAQTQGEKTLGLYTSIKDKDCAVADSSNLDPEAEIDYLNMSCPALGGYEVEISGSDIRYDLKLYYQGQKITLPQPMGFHDMASDVIEWRYSREAKSNDQGKVLKLWALIYRINADIMDDNGNTKQVSALNVVRLDQKDSCLVGSFSTEDNPGQNLEKLSLAAAEDSSLKCLSASKEL